MDPNKTTNMSNVDNLKPVAVEMDPITKRKFIMQEGRKIEIVKTFKMPKAAPHSPTNAAIKVKVLKQSDLMMLGKDGSQPNKDVTVKLMTFNLHKRSVSTSTDITTAQNSTQTHLVEKCDQYTQTDKSAGENLLDFLVDSKFDDDILKYNIFTDVNRALTFDMNGNLPLHQNVMDNNVSGVKRSCLILHTLRKSVNIPNQQHYSALHLAVLQNTDLEILQTLIKYGANLEQVDNVGNSAVHLAIEHGRRQHLIQLVQECKVQRICLDSFNQNGFTPLILAVLAESANDVELLLEYRVDPNIRDMKSGRTALFHAAELGNYEIVKLLMDSKADTKMCNFMGTSVHDAMFEIENVPFQIKWTILGGKNSQKIAPIGPSTSDSAKVVINRKRTTVEPTIKVRVDPIAVKKSKIQTLPVLQKIKNTY